MPDWSSVFAPTVPIMELVVRGSVMFLAIFLLVRLMGQRESGGLGITDVLVVVIVAEAAAPGLHGDATSVGDAIVMVVAILIWSLALDAVSYRWPAVARAVKGLPKVLIEDGEPNPRTMRRELITREEIESMLRVEGVPDIATVRCARIEPNGMISVEQRDGQGSEAPEPPAAL